MTHVSDLYSNLADIEANVRFVAEHLADLQIADSERSAIAELCEEFGGAIHDVRIEIRNLEDKLGMHPGEPPFDPDITNPDPRVTMRFISNWMWEPIKMMNTTIQQLQSSRSNAYLLVAESGANVLNSFDAMRDSLDQIGRELVL